jgi:LmbE family N-acetylglucosaminyl deacetylase
MLAKAKDYIRRRLRGMQRGGQYPLLLPHHVLAEDGLETVNGDRVALGAGLKRALGLCDGSRRLAEIAREAGVGRSELIKAQDDGLVLIWRSEVPIKLPALGHHPHSIIVSPHLDDAALSCGGRMLGNQAVLVLNIVSKTAWWRFGETAAEKISSCRQAEEGLVSRLSGAVMKEMDLPEALLRGYAMGDVFLEGKKTACDEEASAQVKSGVAELAREHPLAHWFLPLGVGGHVDHLLTRDAALEALRAAPVRGTHLHFYEDLPYAAKLGPAADFSKQVPGYTLREELLEIDELIGWKLELLRAYWSQFRWAEIAELGAYAKAVAGDGAAEVTWTPI